MAGPCGTCTTVRAVRLLPATGPRRLDRPRSRTRERDSLTAAVEERRRDRSVRRDGRDPPPGALPRHPPRPVRVRRADGGPDLRRGARGRRRQEVRDFGGPPGLATAGARGGTGRRGLGGGDGDDAARPRTRRLLRRLRRLDRGPCRGCGSGHRPALRRAPRSRRRRAASRHGPRVDQPLLRHPAGHRARRCGADAHLRC